MESPHTPHTLKIQELLKSIAKKRESKAVPKPTLEDFNGDADAHGKALEIWRIDQEERLAHAVLDNANATFSARERANRTLRNCKKRRRGLEPIDDDDSGDVDNDAIRVRRYPFLNWIDDPAPNQQDESPWAERFPYQDSQKSRYLTSAEARQQHKNLCLCMDEFERIGELSPQEQKAYRDEQETDHKARMEQQNQDQESMQSKFKRGK
jgi:hypothetical protein